MTGKEILYCDVRGTHYNVEEHVRVINIIDHLQ